MRERSEHSANEWLAQSPKPGRLVAKPKRENKIITWGLFFVCLGMFAAIGVILAIGLSMLKG